ncbi:hypothetical protein [Thiomicrorhabdus cannonii]|uniref:hypothetical protein n=1 Tax=Thiomicrorhabdus cannonii TaxID=2748011 RepID=UPI0015C05E3B|nr:hypothetical protein [Thiomicrorhabdus cannonii]
MTRRAEIKKSGTLTPREYIWGEIRKLKKFTLNDILDKAPKHYRLNIQKARHYLRGWERAGYLSSVFDVPVSGKKPPKIYTLEKDTGVNPPRVDINGNEYKKGMVREQMWRTMRMVGSFTAAQLAANATTDDVVITETTAKKFIHSLYQAGYLRLVKPGHKEYGTAEYQLKPAAWTGNKPPLVSHMNVVFDQNTNKVVWPKDEDIESEY